MDEMALDPTAGNDGSEAASASSCLGATGGSSSSRLDSQLQEAIRLKTEGNGFYREKNVRTAIGRYHRALLVLRGLDSEVNNALQGFGAQVPKLSQEQEDLLRSTQVDCYNNLAAQTVECGACNAKLMDSFPRESKNRLKSCLLQREVVDYTRVLEYSLKVLKWRAGDIKALYRGGVASLELGDAQKARQYLIQASRGKPNDADVKKQLQRVEERLSQDYKKEKALYKGMFSKQKQGEEQLAEEKTQNLV